MTVVTMVVRLDVYSLLYGLLLGILLLLNRRRCATFWPFYMVLLMVVLLVQYLFCLGLPYGICWGRCLAVVLDIIRPRRMHSVHAAYCNRCHT